MLLLMQEAHLVQYLITLVILVNHTLIPANLRERKLRTRTTTYQEIGTRSCFLSFCRHATARSSKKPSTLELVESELNQYEQKELLDLDSDPLLWWKTHRVQYPSLTQLLKQLWSLPAISVRFEEISSAGNVLTQLRLQLSAIGQSGCIAACL